MPHYRLVIEYDGRELAGWQVQAGGERTVQGCLVEALEQITGEQAQVKGSGRTDAGVHADAQVASLTLAADIAPEQLARSLNGVLPRDIAIREVTRVGADFDAQRSAHSKQYRYRIWNAPGRSPLRAGRFAHVPSRLDLEAMRRASLALLGEHDFTSFRAAGSSVKTSVRTLYELEISGEPGGEIDLRFMGSGFLRYMVRNIVGTLIEVGLGRRAPDQVAVLLAARDREQAGPTAPAHGLTLEWVRYRAAAADEPATGGHSTGKTLPSDRREA
jgi:tRNA pseudouridine38-40 synthase